MRGVFVVLETSEKWMTRSSAFRLKMSSMRDMMATFWFINLAFWTRSDCKHSRDKREREGKGGEFEGQRKEMCKERGE